MDFLGIQGYHVLITGAAGAIGQETIKEFLGKAGFFAIMSRIP
jgi:NAD(P)-dependent dehydrogenase (short-subunit alcohol dehydrogenase family)